MGQPFLLEASLYMEYTILHNRALPNLNSLRMCVHMYSYLQYAFQNWMGGSTTPELSLAGLGASELDFPHPAEN